ncbi:GH12 family glycosyl hydrolase domain-containing protein [Teredinibacter haidensis]|uniref:GH12 family glycosyl hydrolase domain-containing protein n=1 Tax=Teredinibacter haidensis TaxID=2731755 RepID=UPI001115350A|nr:glycoside hydrolase family 12 [Teredinibacter haidensis]
MGVIKITKIICLLTLLFMLFSCENETWIKPESNSLGCSDYLSIKSPDGTLYNNVWNKKAAKSYKWTQCLEKNPIIGGEIYGWSWDWPSSNNVIYAYPQIKLGSSPWDPKPLVDDQFPLKISELNELTISHDVLIDTNGQHNLATSMWLIDSPNEVKKLSKSSIMAELMIWTYSTPEHFNPAGKLYDTFKAGNKNWEVWVEKNWGDLSGENDNKWTYVTFRATNSDLKSSFNALELIQYAIEKDILKQEWYISDIELGTEIMSGAGIAWINSFNVDFK